MSKIEQVAAVLREDVAKGRWSREVPGKDELSMDYGVNTKTVGLAMQLLEKEGLLINQGSGRPRRIAKLDDKNQSLRIKILLYDRNDYALFNNRDLIHELAASGHNVNVVEKTQSNLGMNVKRLAEYVRSVQADAWIVTAAPRDILEWFSQQPIPALAQFGQSNELNISSVSIDKASPIRDAIKRLVELGHRRIVFISRSERRKPKLPLPEQAFLQELESYGITTGSYHLPEWSSRIPDFHRCLESLFGKTPPTAMIIDESVHFLAAQLFLARKGIVAPRDVSMICLDPDQAFSWCDPMISHIGWNRKQFIGSVSNWVNAISAGDHSIMRMIVRAKFMEGGTIGPVSKR
jgi:DNA-binding LacI/PurR family transcriptional regulator